MSEVQLYINSKETRCHEEMTILQAAQQIGIEIPTLCYSPDLHATGVCRICVVEVEGQRTLVGACHTQVAPGMVIRTHTPKVLVARRLNVELLQAAHDAICVTDPTCQQCDLHKLCADFQVRRVGFSVRHRRSYPIEEDNPYVRRICQSVFYAAGVWLPAVKSRKRISYPSPIAVMTPRSSWTLMMSSIQKPVVSAVSVLAIARQRR